MTEWGSLLLVFWLLWGIDGWRLPPVERFGLTVGKRSGRLRYERLLPPAWWPAHWTVTVADIPFSLSPDGICNRPVGAAGRPTDAPAAAVAWRWAEITAVAAKGGWLEINGRRFVRDTGHLNSRDLLALAALAPAERSARIAWWVRRWLRPAHLRRRAKILRRRTEFVAMLNGIFLVLAAVVTVYLVGGFSDELPPRWAERVGRVLPMVALYLFGLHVVAVIAAWRALKRLKPISASKRAGALFTAAMLPPQALRLRSIAGDGWFPPQHPLAWALAFARPAHLREIAFATVADLRWPVRDERDSPLAKEISRWYRTELGRELTPLLRAAAVEETELFAPPVADSPASRQYCPRCQCQFTTERERCPHGVKLEPVLAARAPRDPN